MNNPLNNLQWQGNSRKMYVGILRAVPSLFVGSVNRSIINWVLKNNIKVVTEDVVFRAVNEIAPPNLAYKIKRELMKYKSE